MVPYWRLSAYYFFYFAFIGAFSPYFTLYLQSLQFSAWDIGVLMSLMQVMRLLAPNLWGWLADRLGAKMPIVRGAALMSVAGFSCFFLTQSFTGFFFGMALLAFFWSASLPLVEALTFSHLGQRASGYGSIRLWGSVGFIVAVLGLGWLLDRLPLSAMLWVSLGILGGILACALALPEKREERHESDRLPIGDILHRREVKSLFAACFFMSAAHGALYVFYSIYLVSHGYGTTMVGFLWTLGVVAEIIVFLYLPRLLHIFRLRTILLFSFACAVARFLMIGWGVEWLWIVLVAQVLHAATFGAYHAASVAAVNRWFSGRHQARGQALYGSISFGAGGMLGGLVSGWTWDVLGAELTYSLSSAFALAGMIILWRGWRPSVRNDVS
ncbi:MAG: MFS transporter [Rhodocyclaceae bacterium]|nr:MFS transporter [Rhodocyclaceae bacterium]MCP5296636.1 MFS transporter [Zoogloeaceae bacterium]MCW5594284.1 MFS transporter [Rhodocyclaceae bacterium]